VVEKEIAVNGKMSKAFRIEQPDGTWGYTGERGEEFHVVVENHISESTSLRWHGLRVPNDQDGVPFVTQAPIEPGATREYRFRLSQAGTYWMRSHSQLQIQRLLAAPLVVREPGPPTEPDVVMFLADWSFRDPKVIWAEMRKELRPDASMGRMRMVGGPPRAAAARGAAGRAAAARGKGAPAPARRDVADVDYDAFLTNGRTLSDPEVVRVQPGSTVRLRAINGAAGTNFFLMLGSLAGQAVAVDAQPVVPLQHPEFELAIGQRLDVRVRIPAGEGVYPIFAQGEGTNRRTGLLLATPRATVPTLSEAGPVKIDELGFGQELRLVAADPLPRRPVDRSLTVDLDGNMVDYVWRLNGKRWPDTVPLQVRQGERVDIQFRNRSGMDHSMHLHGHVFQVMELGGNRVSGPKRDTLLLNAQQSARIQLDADNPGVWMLHCHVLYHEGNGMMTTMTYEGVPVPDFGPRQ
jgi:FtsP/CotA-like multicopper oxidase with cupredoxin domain